MKVTDDVVRYMDAAAREEGNDFFVTDPQWAMDFAPNGYYHTYTYHGNLI
jgi:hypothetical protein